MSVLAVGLALLLCGLAGSGSGSPPRVSGQQLDTPLASGWLWCASDGCVCSVPATVPGQLQLDLYRRGVLRNHPFTGEVDQNMQWIAEGAWTLSLPPAELRRAVLAAHPALLQGEGGAVVESALLVAEGLDTVASVYANKSLLGNSSNMFLRTVFELPTGTGAVGARPSVSEWLSSLELRIVFHSVVAYGAAERASNPQDVSSPSQYSQYSWCGNRTYVRKEQSSYGWNWGPCVLPVGVYRPIRLVLQTVRAPAAVPASRPTTVAGRALLVDAIPTSRMVSLSKAERTGNFTVDVRLVLRPVAPGTVTVATTTGWDGHRILHDFTFTAAGPEQTFAYQLTATNVRLWYPRTLGEPHLYHITFALLDGRGEHAVREDGVRGAAPSAPPCQSFCPTIAKRLGFRHVELRTDPVGGAQPGRLFYFEVNGEARFMRGANVIPTSLFAEDSNATLLRRVIEGATMANMDLLRVWGGGRYAQDQFYDLTDEIGILVWQEIMFACSVYPDHPAFLETVGNEIRVVLYCGNNEIEANNLKTPEDKAQYTRLNYGVVVPTIQASDSSRGVWPSSPSNGFLPGTSQPAWGSAQSRDQGDVHFYMYNDLCSDAALLPNARFVSEYGWPSYEDFSKLRRWATFEQDLTVDSDWTTYRQDLNCHNTAVKAMLARWFPPTDWSQNTSAVLERFVYLGQALQGMCIKAQSEHFRRARDTPAHSMGALYWQLNSEWPGASKSSLDYLGGWKLLHHLARRFFEPVHITVSVAAADNTTVLCHVANDALAAISGHVSLQVLDWTGAVLGHRSISLPALGSNTGLTVYNASLSALGCPNPASCLVLASLSATSQGVVAPGSPAEGPWSSTDALFPARLTAGVPEVAFDVNVTQAGDRQAVEIEVAASRLAVLVYLEAAGFEGDFADNAFQVLRPHEHIRTSFRAWNGTVEAGTFAKALRIHSVNNARPWTLGP